VVFVKTDSKGLAPTLCVKTHSKGVRQKDFSTERTEATEGRGEDPARAAIKSDCEDPPPPIFSDVWQAKDFKVRRFGCVAIIGLTGALCGCVAMIEVR
jgi:hypothetical protein